MFRLLPMLALAACSAQPWHPAANRVSGAPAELVGHLRWVGEYQIYPSEAAMRRGPIDDPPGCISGVFSRGEVHDELSRRFHGRKVRLVGRWEASAPLLEALYAADPFRAGSGLLENACGGERVFIADDALAVD